MSALLLDAARLFLVLVLAGAALHKLVQQERLAAATARLTTLSPVIATPLMYAATATEAIAAALLMNSTLAPVGAVVATLIWTAYAFALALSHRRGDEGDCGCSFGRSAHRPAAPWARPMLLAAAALVVAAMPSTPGLLAFAAPAALAGYALFLAAGELAALPRRSRSHA